LGIRITGIGYYIKMASDMRRKEREANDALQQQVSALKANAKQNAQAQKAEIEDKYAQEVAALEHKEAEELQELQQLLAQRVLEAKKLSDTEVGRFAVSDMTSKVQTYSIRDIYQHDMPFCVYGEKTTHRGA